MKGIGELVQIRFWAELFWYYSCSGSISKAIVSVGQLQNGFELELCVI